SLIPYSMRTSLMFFPSNSFSIFSVATSPVLFPFRQINSLPSKCWYLLMNLLVFTGVFSVISVLLLLWLFSLRSSKKRALVFIIHKQNKFVFTSGYNRNIIRKEI